MNSFGGGGQSVSIIAEAGGKDIIVSILFIIFNYLVNFVHSHTFIVALLFIQYHSLLHNSQYCVVTSISLGTFANLYDIMLYSPTLVLVISGWMVSTCLRHTHPTTTTTSSSSSTTIGTSTYCYSGPTAKCVWSTATATTTTTTAGGIWNDEFDKCLHASTTAAAAGSAAFYAATDHSAAIDATANDVSHVTTTTKEWISSRN